MPRRSIPHRLRDRAKKTGRLAAAVAVATARRVVRKSEADDQAFGHALVAELDTMKGMAMKVGQILSYMDGTLPPETQAVLQKLQRGAEPIAWESVRTQIEAGLGAPVETLFDDVQKTAIAAASIGQVHRATVNETPVAVKVQYPNVQATFEADLTQMRRIAKVASLATRVDGLAIVTDIQDRLLEECDYSFEARWLTQFGVWFAGHPDKCLPAVVADRSCNTVLTTTWCDGMDFYTFVATATPKAKHRAAVALLSFAMTSLYVHGAINADPHPGNYLFSVEGRVTFLDFGCVRVLSKTWQQHDRAIVLAVLDGDREAFASAVMASGIVAVPAHRFDFDKHWHMVSWELAPYLNEHFHFTAEYAAEASAFTQPSNANMRKLAITAEWVWIERLRFGLHAVLTRLDAQGDFRSVLLQALVD